MPSQNPLDDFRALVERMPPLGEAAGKAVTDLFASQGAGSSGLAAIAATVARAIGARPSVSRPSLALFAGAHGIARHGLSAQRMDATLAMVAACGSGDAAVNHLCAANMIGLKVYDLALHLPTGDISAADAMDERNGAATMAFGMEAIAGGADCVLLASIGSSGDETVAGAVLAAFHGGAAEEWLPADERLAKRAALVKAALAREDVARRDPLAKLTALGGREFAAIAGAIIAARTERIAVILEGLTALAAASALAAIDGAAIGHCLLADAHEGPAARAAKRLGLQPLVAQGLAAGAGTSAALGVSVLRDALALHAGFAAHARTAHAHTH